MGLQHEQVVPPSFGQASGGKYLGDPVVVLALLARFCAQTDVALADLGAGRLKKGEFESAARSRIRALAAILGGRDAAYSFPVGWNDVSLPPRLVADLGEFWRTHRSKWADDAVAVLLEWLTCMFAEKWKAADGDDQLLAASFGPTITDTVRRLVGTAPRA
jgi:hypothetical protein